MGNRAVITTKENFENDGVGVYLHWNGGRDSVNAFLKYCEIKGYRSPDTDCYGYARLCQVVGNFFGGNISIGIDKISRLGCEYLDNGVYIIEDWEIVDRKYFDGLEQDKYDLTEFLKVIDESQPENEQLGGYLTAKEVDSSELEIGDQVYIMNYEGKPEPFTIVGFGEDGATVNGHKVGNIPYVNKYNGMSGYCNNINNYILEKKVKITGYKQVGEEK